MEKEPRRVFFRATPIICFLVLPLLYAYFYGSNAVPFYQREQRFSSWQLSLSSTKAIETREEHDSRPLILSRREVDETLEKRGSEMDETLEKQDSRPLSLSSREVDETPQAHESRLLGLSSKEVAETLHELESGQMCLSERDFNETEQGHEFRQFSLSKSEVGGTVGEQKFSQLSRSNRELNATKKEPRAEKLNFSNREENGTVEDEKSGQLIIEATNVDESEKEGINQTVAEGRDSTQSLSTRLVRGEDRTKLETTGFACDTAIHSVVCVVNKPVRIEMKTMKIHVPANNAVEAGNTVVRPYARQEDEDVLRNVRPVQILHGKTTAPACQYTHDVPAVIFSSSGFTGNLFHEFNEIIIPLFLTTYNFRSQVRFILMDYKASFVDRYRQLLGRLSSYDVINPVANTSVHCFPGAVAGLKFHDHLALNSSEIPGGYTMDSFRQFLRQTYNLKITNVSKIKRPKVMLISRPRTRMFLNEEEMVKMMKELGFEVVLVKEPNRMSKLNKFAKVVNSCCVLVGTHGAGLANELFLPDGAVMVQIEPLGLEWASAAYFGDPAREMKVHYLRYKIEPEESSLFDIYGRNHPVIADPASIFAQGYQAARAVYIDRQNMRVNLVRLKETLLEALRITGCSNVMKQ